MWCELQNSPSTTMPYHCGGESGLQNPHLHHHHDFPHFSQNHIQCFQNGMENQSAFQVYGNTEMDYGQACAATCHPCWPSVVPDGRENYCPFESSNCCSGNSSSPNLPVDAARSEQTKLFREISQECEHLLARGECEQCTVRDEKGEEQSIPISDLVEIVLKTAESIKQEPGDTIVLSKKRQQNKMAAAKYRDRQKTKWREMQDERESLEKRNSELKISVSKLQKEVNEMRRKLLNRPY